MSKPYDFMRCKSCSTLLTLPMRDRQMQHGTYCECGSRDARPSWPVKLEWVTPQVIWFAILRTFGRI